MRYGIAAVVAALIIGAGALYARQVGRSVEGYVRQALREAKAAGQLPPDIDPEHAEFRDFGVNLPASLTREVDVAHFMIVWRAALIPAVLLGSLGAARFLGRKRQ